MLEIKLLPGSEVEITGEISAEDFEHERAHAIIHLSEDIKIDGFRPGKAPEKVIIDKIGERNILDKMAVLTLQREYSKIIAEKKIKAIGRPSITITKIAVNNPLGFKIKTYVMPEVELPDYKKIKVLEKIIELAKVDIPKILIDPEKGDEKQVKTELVLNEIAEQEKIEVSKEELNTEVEKVMNQYKDLDRNRV
ncbi:MAG: trigger factor, partial [Candidatus Parcubacteria bacterium]|nr:trigger factor [Candidatus Parcubacteria bacterium]